MVSVSNGEHFGELRRRAVAHSARTSIKMAHGLRPRTSGLSRAGLRQSGQCFCSMRGRFPPEIRVWQRLAPALP
jgi:hypothetical protein